MKLAVVFVACAACASDPDVTEPILASDPTMLAFHLDGVFEYQIDAQAQTIAGHRVVERDGQRCRTTLAATPADPQLAAILDQTFVTTLGEDSCKKLQAGCGGDPTGYLAVTIDGAESFTSHEDCHHLTSQYDLEIALGDVFDAAVPRATPCLAN